MRSAPRSVGLTMLLRPGPLRATSDRQEELMAVTLNDLTRMSQAELDNLFRASPLGDIPDGDADGTVIAEPRTDVEGPILWFGRWLAWRGKVFDRSRATLLNKVGPFGWHLIRASVYIAPSWFDN